jgi:hypothetical protein
LEITGDYENVSIRSSAYDYVNFFCFEITLLLLSSEEVNNVMRKHPDLCIKARNSLRQ